MSAFSDWLKIEIEENGPMNHGEEVLAKYAFYAGMEWAESISAEAIVDLQRNQFNAGMERAAEILKSHNKLFTYNLVKKVTEVIRKEIE